MKMSFYKKIMLTGCMAGLLLPLTAMADDHPFAGGSGTTRDPYLVETPEQFNAIRDYRSSRFKLIADLDFKNYDPEDPEGWWPIGEWGSGDGAAERFSGTFDGDGHTIRNLVAERVAHDLSIFGVTDGAKIVNLVIEDCSIEGEGRLGVLTGATFRTEIDQVAVINSDCLNTKSDHGSNAGGITGPLTQSTITNSYSIGGIIYGKDAIGGIASKMENGGTIANCYSTCSIEGDTNIGGITGMTTNGYIINCVALNETIMCHDVNDGRIAGIVNGDDLLSNNYAGIEVTINDAEEMTTDLGANMKNGENVATADLSTVAFYAQKANWAIPESDPTIEDYQQIWKLDNTISTYPVFVWQKGSNGNNITLNKTGNIKVHPENNAIIVTGAQQGDAISLYTISGILINKGIANSDITTLQAPANGIYIVTVNEEVFKIAK